MSPSSFYAERSHEEQLWHARSLSTPSDHGSNPSYTCAPGQHEKHQAGCLLQQASEDQAEIARLTDQLSSRSAVEEERTSAFGLILDAFRGEIEGLHVQGGAGAGREDAASLRLQLEVLSEERHAADRGRSVLQGDLDDKQRKMEELVAQVEDKDERIQGMAVELEARV